MLKEIFYAPRNLGKFGAFLVFQLKLWRYCVKLLKQNRCGQQAAALSYHTIFGLVPLIIVMLLVFQSTPASQEACEKLRTFVYEQTQLQKIEYPDPENPAGTIKLTEKIDEITNNFFTRLDKDKGSLTIISGIIVIWAAIALLTIIERTFNRIWHILRGRSILQRIVYYWATLTLAPVLLGFGLYVSTKYAMAEKISTAISLPIGVILPYLISVLALFLLYVLMPNTKVDWKAALWGAAVAALVWAVAKWAFRFYVTDFIPYRQIYGIIGLIPLTVFWVFVTWLIILFGLQLTFTTQNLKTLDAAEMQAGQKPQEYFIANDLTAINIMRHICVAFEKNQGPVSVENICSKLNLPDSFAEKLLEHFVAKGLLVRTSKPIDGFVPAAEPANITLEQITDAVANTALAPDRPESLQQLIQSRQASLAQYNLKQISEDG